MADWSLLLPACLPACLLAHLLQAVKEACPDPSAVLVLPFDLLGPEAGLEAAAQTADGAFGGAGIDYLIHNAGAAAQLQSSHHWGLTSVQAACSLGLGVATSDGDVTLCD
jgi:NAD(P)-dependent dehydrogenase (short-subunit alcohol dehydrogenase family)